MQSNVDASSLMWNHFYFIYMHKYLHIYYIYYIKIKVLQFSNYHPFKPDSYIVFAWYCKHSAELLCHRVKVCYSKQSQRIIINISQTIILQNLDFRNFFSNYKFHMTVSEIYSIQYELCRWYYILQYIINLMCHIKAIK